MFAIKFSTLLVSMVLSSTLSIGLRPLFSPEPSGLHDMALSYSQSLAYDDLTREALSENRFIAPPPPDGALLSITKRW